MTNEDKLKQQVLKLRKEVREQEAILKRCKESLRKNLVKFTQKDEIALQSSYLEIDVYLNKKRKRKGMV